MATSRAQKIENAANLREDLAAVPHAFLVDFAGLDVMNATDLRRKIREQEGTFRVVKNATALRAVEELPLAELADAFVGQTAIAYTSGDAVGLAKVLRDFHKEFETPSFKAGIVDGDPISAEQFDQLAQLPGRDELIAKALYLMNYPVSGLVTVLGGVLRQAVTVLERIREQKEAAGGDAAPAEAEEAAVVASGEADVEAEDAAPDTADEAAPAEEEAAPAEEEAAPAEEEAAPAEEEAAPAEEEAAPAEEEAAPAEEEAAPAEEEAAPAEEEAAPAEEEAVVEDEATDEEE